MPFQPASTPVAGVAVQVYVPAKVGTPNVTISNNGTSVVYLGGSSVTAATGLPLQPAQSVNFPYYTQGIWAVSGITTLGSATTLSAAAAQGAGTVAATATAGYAAGQVMKLGTGSAAETLTVGSVPSGTAVVFTSGLRFAHASGEALALVSATAGTSLNVLAGTG